MSAKKVENTIIMVSNVDSSVVVSVIVNQNVVNAEEDEIPVQELFAICVYFRPTIAFIVFT